MGRPKKNADDKPAESLDEFIARIEREHELSIVAAKFPDTQRDFVATKSGFKITEGEPAARLSSGEWVE